jgi:peptidoglycan L-alanyl-D-glutamate endopeptidase CwlK
MARKHSNKKILIFVVICIVALGGIIFIHRTITVKSSTVPVPTGMNPNFLNQVNECFIPTAAVYGYTLRITSGFRSMTEQAQIYDDGRNGSGTIISEAPPGHSLHNYGYAVDIVDRWKGYDIDWTKLIAIANYCHLENGGPGDLPHFEYRGGLTTDDFAAGLRPPPLTLPCPLMATRASENQPLTLADLKSCNAPDF